MLFHEIYGSYYSCVARILRESGKAPLSVRRMIEIVEQGAFEESTMIIPDALRTGQWPLMEGGQSVLLEAPSMPMTTLQKRWLKTLLLDPRIRLFDPPETGLEDVEPLYDPDVFVYFDRYTDGDPYEDPVYIRNYRTLMTALRENRRVRLRYANQWGREKVCDAIPCRMEYSEKDDKFRVLTRMNHGPATINIARIRDCQLLESVDPGERNRYAPAGTRTLVLELTDWRNTLERAMLHFSHLEKTAEKLDEKHYRLTLTYNAQDETELLIRVLSFGPTVKVVHPESFAALVKARLQKQNELRT